MIISKPYGGISNRIKCLLSSMDIDEDIKLVWDYSLYDGGVWCKFSDLFENDYEEFFSQDGCLNKYPNTNIYTECKFFGNNTYNHLDLIHGDNWWKFIDENTKQRYRTLISKLIPKQYVKEKIEYYSKLFDDKTISVSVRTWNDRVVTREKKGIHFKIDKLYEYIDKYVGYKFFLTCDDQETFNNIIDKYGEKIIYTDKRTKFGDFSTAEGLQDALVDLYLSGKNDTILSSYGSSFCELQWWFGNSDSEIIMMDLHPSYGISIP